MNVKKLLQKKFKRDNFKYLSLDSNLDYTRYLADFHAFYREITTNDILFSNIPHHLKNDHVRLHNYTWDVSFPISRVIERKFAQKDKGDLPLICGILGCQGIGKSLVTDLLQYILEFQGHRVVKFSIDDFYVDFEKRRELEISHPYLYHRGPPGTHDVQMALDTIESLKQREEGIEIPVFDKTLYEGKGDRSGFTPVLDPSEVDIVIFEGWFVGFNHIQDETMLPINSDLSLFSNENLKEWQNWDFLDTLIALKPQEFNYSIDWRKEAEMRKGGMQEKEIEAFVNYFFESLDPNTYYGNLIQDGIKGENELSMVVEFSKDRNVQNYQFVGK